MSAAGASANGNAGYYSKELVNMCAHDEKFLLRALQYCQNDATPPGKRGWYYIDKEGKVQPQPPQVRWLVGWLVGPDAEQRSWLVGWWVVSDLHW